MKKKADRINKIMVAIDFSSYSEQTLDYAVEISRITNAQLILINIINQKEIDSVRKAVNLSRPGTFQLEKHLFEEMDRRKSKLKALIKVTTGLTELPIKIVVEHGVPYEEIVKAVNREGADFLVFGPKGRTNFKGFLFGTVAEKLFRHSPVPVMGVRYRVE